MCFIGSKVRKVAVEDIPCYKVMSTMEVRRRKWWEFWKKLEDVIYISFYHHYIYHSNEKNPTVQLYPLQFSSSGVVIYQGYHSYKMKCSAYKGATDDFVRVQCIIPKGSTYFENSNEYVSSNIIVTDQLLPQIFSESDIL